MADEPVSAGDEIPSGSGRIEVYVRDLDQLFNSMDPSPFHRKTLDRDAEDFIVSSAKEVPADAPLELLVHLAGPAGLADESGILRDAIRRHFARRREMARRELRQLLRRGRKSLMIGLPLLAASVLGSHVIAGLTQTLPIAVVLRESLVIGGWVAMWGPLEIFLYEWWPIRDQGRLHDRLSRVAIRIVHTATGQDDGVWWGPADPEGPGLLRPGSEAPRGAVT